MKKHHIMKKILSLTVIFTVLLTGTVYAENKTTIDNVGNNSVVVSGTVEPTIVSADVTLSGAFAIKPNEADTTKRFISPTIKIVNTSVVPLKVTAVSLKHRDEAPTVVAPNKFTEEQWSKLGINETKSNIALGLESPSFTSFWFAEESTQTPTELKQLYAGEELDMTLQSKHGLAWSKGKQINYDLVFELEMVE
jgi:hypothetical protein